MDFTPCQIKALLELKTNKNCFVTGFAGTGKSFLIRQFIKGLDRKTFPVLASTGVSAVIIGGRTFHSFFGLGVMEGGLEATIDRASGDRRVKSRITKTEAFVLDEVSMISGTAFTAAETLCRKIRKNRLPWGGIRVIAVGDFAQLPPVNRSGQDKDWAFLSDAWTRSAFTPLLLNTIVRTVDQEYIEVLNTVRHGDVTNKVTEYLNSKTEEWQDGFRGTCLFPLRKTTESYNNKRLAEIDSRLMTFETKYTGSQRHIDLLKKTAPIPQEILLKESALVMTRINDPAYRYINGSTGHVIDINNNTLLIKLKNNREIELTRATFSLLDADGEEVASATNFPVNLAYATTIHKSQGTTLSDLMIDLKRLWEPGQAYVALSRLESGEGLKLSGWSPSSIKADPQVLLFHQKLLSESQ
ncbi:MAG: AAA family ATPase [Deltaproteobacteria bacterium]|nr:AAA family ATPase [Deltaproteobacteria bacterium]